MTLGKLLKLYQHYKDNYDFQLTKKSYRELQEQANHDGEFIKD